MDFTETLQEHLSALENKDLERFLQTIHPSNITLILPTGKLINTSHDFMSHHQSWFLDPDWQFTYEVVTTTETKEMASALLLIDYDDVNRDEQPYHLQYYLHLLFVKAEDQWLLVHDQNTPIS